MKPASHAPTYVAMYPMLAAIARSHGYALAVHGSVSRDFDVVCIPWAVEVSRPQTVVDQIVNTSLLRVVGEPETKLHGRLVYTISIGFGECFVDLSFMPRLPIGLPACQE